MATAFAASARTQRGKIRRFAALALLGGLAQAAASAAADAMFLARVGVSHFGTVLAISSALLIVVLGFLGTAADRHSRRRLLLGVAVTAAVVHGLLALAMGVMPVLASSAAVVLTKQAAASFDLLLFVLAAERFDARENRALVPLFVFAGGAGMVIGALATSALVFVIGAPAVLGLAGAAMLGAAAVATGLESRQEALRVIEPAPRPPRSWGGVIAKPLAALRERPLARHLGALVALGGMFGPLLYFALGAAASTRFANEAELASFLGAFRAVLQVVVVALQFALAPLVLRRAGVGLALVITPVGALVAATLVGVGDGLWAIAAAQGLMRALDAAVATPAEKLAQNLLPRAVRGRVAGALEGLAKRTGAIAGGLLASAVALQIGILAAAAAAVALAWTVASLGLARRFAGLAVRELSRADARDRRELVEDLQRVGEGRLGQRLLGDLVDGSAVAIDLAERFDHQAELDGVDLLLQAEALAGTEVRDVLRAAVARVLRRRIDGARTLAEAHRERIASWIQEGALAPGLRAEFLVACYAAQPAWARRLVEEGAGRADPSDALALACELIGAPSETPAPDRREAADPALAAAGADADLRLTRSELIAEYRSHHQPALRHLVRAFASIEVEHACFFTAAGSDALLESVRLLVRTARRAPPVDGLDDELKALRLAVTRLGALRTPTAESVLVLADLRELAWSLAERDGSASRVAGLQLVGELVRPEDAARLGHLLGDHDEEVRRGASTALLSLGTAAIEPLIELARFGRRIARDEASTLLSQLPVSSEVLDRLIAAELAMLESTRERIGPFASLPLGRVVVRRLLERVDEVAQTILTLVEARYQQPALAGAAASLRRAQSTVDRARALEALDAALPRGLAARLLSVLDGGTPTDRCVEVVARARRPSAAPVPVRPAVKAELGGDDPITRAFVLHALGEDGRAAHRLEITAAASSLASRQDPLALLQRLTLRADDEASEESNVPRNVETVMLLSRIALFAELSTRQLTELAKVLGWREVAAGETVSALVDGGQVMWVIARGAFERSGHTGPPPLGPGEALGESLLLAPEPAPAQWVTLEAGLIGGIYRSDLEELIDDVPGFALGICRALGRQVAGHGQI